MPCSPAFVLPKVIGHRGACHYAPENTLASLYKASALGATWVEFDVVLTADNQAVILHDETVERTTNGSGLIAQTSFATLATLDAGAWFSPEFAGEKVPTLVEYLHTAAKLNLGINVEIKPSFGAEITTAKKVVELLQQHWPSSAIPPLVSSFSLGALIQARLLDAGLHLGLLLDHWFDGWQAVAASLQCVAVSAQHRSLTTTRIQQAKAIVQYVLAYTVNSRKRALRLYELGVDGVFSNQPDIIN